MARKFVSCGDKSVDRLRIAFSRFARHEIGDRDRLCREKIKKSGRTFGNTTPSRKIRRAVGLHINGDAYIAIRSCGKRWRTLHAPIEPFLFPEATCGPR